MSAVLSNVSASHSVVQDRQILTCLRSGERKLQMWDLIKVLTDLENRRGTVFYRHLGPKGPKGEPCPDPARGALACHTRMRAGFPREAPIAPGSARDRPSPYVRQARPREKIAFGPKGEPRPNP